MKIIEPSYEILTEINNDDILNTIEQIARTCYKSEDKIAAGSAERMIGMLIKNEHEAMIEFFDITVKFIHNRGFSHEMVRHRLCSFAQESTRYCTYSDDKFGKEITVIKPYWLAEVYAKDLRFSEREGLIRPDHEMWLKSVEQAEYSYFQMLNLGLQPQAARGVLPNDLKTEINVKANLREWRAIFKLRCAPAAHPDMRRVMIPLLHDLKKKIPVVFDDIDY